MNIQKPTGIQQRTLRGTQLRAESQGDEMSLVGYAASFNTLSQDLGGFREVISPGAFKRSLASGCDCKCLFNHDASKILGRSGVNLSLEEDSYGLKFRCVLNPKSDTAREVHSLIDAGLVDQCSFAFTCPDDDSDDWDEAAQDGVRFIRRTLRNVKLHDVSCVTYPAYDKGTNVNARSADYTLSVSDAAYRAEMLRKLDAAMKPPQLTWEQLKEKAARLARTL